MVSDEQWLDAALSRIDPRNLRPQSAAQVHRRAVQVRFRDRGPKVELVSRRAAPETTKGISSHINRKHAAPRRRGTVDWARPSQLVAPGLAGHEADQFENVLHQDLFSNGLEVDARQGISPQGGAAVGCRAVANRNREEEPVGITNRSSTRILRGNQIS